MSSFGSKRKARVIKVSDEHADADQPAPDNGATMKAENTTSSFGSRAGRKPFRQSGLRKAFNPNDDDGPGNNSADLDEEDTDGPLVVRPNVSRNSSSSQKKRSTKTSKLSFGADPEGGNDTGSDAKGSKESLSKKVLESSAVKRRLPVRSFEDVEDRPKYSKEYLNELQSSTPNTPRDVSTLHTDSADEMELDASELEGALIVNTPSFAPSAPATKILTEVEIQEKKERRARLAQEQDFLSVEDDDDIEYLGRKKKDDTRLKPEDEEMGEGFDEFVEDGGLSLGKRAEKERTKRDRQQMAEMIHAAEGNTSDSSSDSDAERRMAYEAAQTRAGLEGLKKKPKIDLDQELRQIPPKITPLPSLAECVAKLRASLEGMERDIMGKTATVEGLKAEKEDIAKRQQEVQALLDETGKKYKEAMGQPPAETAAAQATVPSAELLGERGLESIGTTPMRVDEPQEMNDS